MNRLVAHVETALELGRSPTYTNHIAQSLAEFLQLDPEETYACGFYDRGSVVAGHAVDSTRLLVIHGYDIDVYDTSTLELSPRSSLGTLGSASCRVDSEPLEQVGHIEHALARARIVAAAELCGVAQGALAHAVAYGSQREQFGSPVAGYQAMTHRLVDASMAVDAAALAVEHATVEPVMINAARTKIVANHAASFATATLAQIHGGVGFYEDQGAVARYRRALWLAHELGTSRALRRDVIEPYLRLS